MHKILRSPGTGAGRLPSKVEDTLPPSYIYRKKTHPLGDSAGFEHIIHLGIPLQSTAGETDSSECGLKQAQSTEDPFYRGSANGSFSKEQTYIFQVWNCFPPHEVLVSTTHRGLMEYLTHYHRLSQKYIRSGAHLTAKVLWE